MSFCLYSTYENYKLHLYLDVKSDSTISYFHEFITLCDLKEHFKRLWYGIHSGKLSFIMTKSQHFLE